MVEDILRWAVFAAYLVAFILYCHVTAVGWMRRTNPQRVTLVGGAAILAYVTSGQIKAHVYDLPVDALTGLGLLAVLTFLYGIAWVLLRERNRHGGH